MSESKRRTSDQDPDYDNIVSNDQKRLKVIEKDNKEATVRKIESIIKTQFNRERQLKEIELDTVDQRLLEARKMLDQLRACIVISYYTDDHDQEAGPSARRSGHVSAVHPAVRKLLERMSKTSFSSKQTKPIVTSEQVGILMKKESPELGSTEENESAVSVESAAPLFHVEPCEDISRGARFKVKKRIVVGNVSKYIPVDKREEKDQSTHKWMIYVRGSKEEPRIDHFVKKVWFFLHPSYRPNDLVEVSQHPFHLTRRGWGEFPVRIQLQFHDPRDKRVDILHTLKLDKSYTGLQTLGAETLVDVLIYRQEAAVGSRASIATSRSSAETLTNDVGGVVTPADSEVSTVDTSVNARLSLKDGFDGVKVKQEPLDDALSNCVSSPLPPNEEQLLVKPSAVSAELSNSSTGLADGSPSNSTKTDEPAKPANGLSTFVKCVDKHGNLYLIPLTMFLKLNPETQASVMQRVASATMAKNLNTAASTDVKAVITDPTVPSSSNSTSGLASKLASPSLKGSNVIQPFGCGKKTVSLLSGVVKKAPPTAEAANTTVKLVTLPKLKLHTPPCAEMSNSMVRLISPSKNHQLPSKERARNDLVSMLNLDSFESMDLIMKHILKFYPLVNCMNDRASHPYCCESMTTFLSWNIGKRHASEWQRSKAVRMKLVLLCSQCTKWNENQVWSVKKILMFCRHYGYTPMATVDIETVSSGTSLESRDIYTYSEASELLQRIENDSSDLVKTDDEEPEVDVLRLEEIQKTKLISTPVKPTKSFSFRLPSTPACEFVREIMEQIGARVGLEEAVPDVVAPLAEEVLLTATQSFMEDIMRASHKIAFERNERNSIRCPPTELTVSDVVKAVSQLPNCDFLTDRFMGTKIQQYHTFNYDDVRL